MKYTDEEMAEAALLLAHTDTSKAIPADLESTIQERGRAVAQDVRFSTTKAGAIAIEAPPAPVIPIGKNRARIGAYMGWIAAAACFAFAIYEWRTHASAPSTNATQPAPAPAPKKSVLHGPDGTPVAEIEAGGKMKVLHLPSGPGQRYQLWTSSSDAAHATAVGSFTCEPPLGCDGRELGLTPTSQTTHVWLTTVNGAEAAPPTDSAAIVGKGQLSGGS